MQMIKFGIRLFLLSAPFLIPACGGGDGGDNESSGPPVTVVTFAPPGPGTEGMSVGYSNGHPLDWITDNATILAFENDVLTQLNAYRASQVPALGAMTMDANLRKAARGHSRHMRGDIHNFFAHTNPEGHSIGFRATQNGVSWSSLAENIAAGQTTATQVMTDWKNSPGHNTNMLGAYSRIGVGYYDGPGGPYWTQFFAN
jgi:uncharacterized protein YkwD